MKLLYFTSLVLLLSCAKPERKEFTHSPEQEFSSAVAGQWKLPNDPIVMDILPGSFLGLPNDSSIMKIGNKTTYFSIENIVLQNDTVLQWYFRFPTILDDDSDQNSALVAKLTSDTLELYNTNDFLKGTYIRVK